MRAPVFESRCLCCCQPAAYMTRSKAFRRDLSAEKQSTGQHSLRCYTHVVCTSDGLYTCTAGPTTTVARCAAGGGSTGDGSLISMTRLPGLSAPVTYPRQGVCQSFAGPPSDNASCHCLAVGSLDCWLGYSLAAASARSAHSRCSRTQKLIKIA